MAWGKLLGKRIMFYGDLAVDDRLTTKEQNYMFERAKKLSKKQFTTDDKIIYYESMLDHERDFSPNQLLHAHKRLQELYKLKRKKR